MKPWANEPTPLSDKDIDKTHETYGEAFASTWLCKDLERRLRHVEKLVDKWDEYYNGEGDAPDGETYRYLKAVKGVK